MNGNPRYLVIGSVDGTYHYYGCYRYGNDANKMCAKLDDKGIVAEIVKLSLTEIRQIAATADAEISTVEMRPLFD